LKQISTLPLTTKKKIFTLAYITQNNKK